MARIEWVKQRLENWALWKDKEANGGLGFATRSVLLSDAVDRYRETVMPVDDIEAELTNQAVETLRESKVHLYEVIHLIYVAGVGIKETARRVGRAESTVKANLDQSDHVLSRWFIERREVRRGIKSS